jgi:anti-sigma regulatory factor (Ser/Thr protein kinase)
MDETPLPPHVPCTIRAEQTHLRIPGRPEWIAPTAEFLERKAVLCGACPEARGERLRVALQEALSNAIVHGSLELPPDLKERGDRVFAGALAERTADPRYADRLVDIEVVYNGHRCDWVLTQEGRGFDVERVFGRPDLANGNGPAGGRGMLLMWAFVDEVQFGCGGRQVTLSVRKSGCPEKRRAERHPVHGVVRVAPVRADGSADWGAAYGAVVRNRSDGGLGLLQNRPPPTGQVLLGLDTGGEALCVPAEVRHSRRVGESEFEVGCRFRPAAGPVPPGTADLNEALAALGARSPALPHERRAHPRLAYTEPVAIRVEGAGGPRAAFARNLSRDGIAFLTAAPLPAGPCAVELPHRGGPPLRVRAEVVRCVPTDGGFHDAAARFRGAGRPGS